MIFSGIFIGISGSLLIAFIHLWVLKCGPISTFFHFGIRLVRVERVLHLFVCLFVCLFVFPLKTCLFVVST